MLRGMLLALGPRQQAMASKRAKRRRSCTGKRAFPSQAAAIAAARALWRAKGERVQAYRCHWSSHWHIGHYRVRDK
jgi:hypothetical protein